MNDAISPLEFYQQKINSLEQQLAALYKRKSTIAWIRFAIFIVTCLAVYFVWGNGLMLIIITVICGIALFLIAVSKDVDNKDNIKNLETLLSINKDELNYLQQNFSEKFNGKMFEPHQHPYAKDLDVFGPASLFQYINRCNAEQATQLLANRLLTPLSKQSILQQQSTVKAIRAKINWWQQFQAHAIDEKITTASEKRISEWLSMEDKVFVHAKWKLLAYIFPFITLGCVVMYLADILPSAIFSFLVLIFFLISLMITGKIQKLYELLSRLEPVVSTLYMQLHHFEKEHFDDTFLSKLKTSLGGSTDKTASASIKHLQNILSRFDARLNAFAFFILNTLFLWDLWQIIALNNWKKANKTLATNWFNAIAQLEVAGSFATLSFNNPQWYFPAIADEHFTLSGKNIGHPLIAAKQVVTNDFQKTNSL